MALLIASGAVGAPTSLAGLLAATHAHAPLLYVIDTAPIFLGLFAGFAGVRQSKLVVLNASLEQQVADQTASLRDALQRRGFRLDAGGSRSNSRRPSGAR